MMDLRARNILCPLLALALGACAVIKPAPPGPSGTVPPTVSAEPGRYSATRAPDEIAELRASPPPSMPEIADGQSPDGDERVLRAKGYVRIGEGSYSGSGEKAREWLIAKARDVAADRVQIYPPTNDGGDGAPHAAYYVKFKLPFGATFRDLHDEERDAVGATGVRLDKIIGNSPADQANLRSGDIVLKFNGEAVRDRAQFQQLLRTHMGKRVTLVVSRDGAVLSRLVRMGVLATDGDGAR